MLMTDNAPAVSRVIHALPTSTLNHENRHHYERFPVLTKEINAESVLTTP